MFGLREDEFYGIEVVARYRDVERRLSDFGLGCDICSSVEEQANLRECSERHIVDCSSSEGICIVDVCAFVEEQLHVLDRFIFHS
jgi:hypothetical protein